MFKTSTSTSTSIIYQYTKCQKSISIFFYPPLEKVEPNILAQVSKVVRTFWFHFQKWYKQFGSTFSKGGLNKIENI